MLLLRCAEAGQGQRAALSKRLKGCRKLVARDA